MNNIINEADAMIHRLADFHIETLSNGVETVCIKNSHKIAETLCKLFIGAGWQPISTIPKDGTRVYLKNQNGQVDYGEWYPTGDKTSAGGINSVHGLGSDDNELGYSWWQPYASPAPTADREKLVGEIVQAIRDADNGENNMHDIARACLAVVERTKAGA